MVVVDGLKMFEVRHRFPFPLWPSKEQWPGTSSPAKMATETTRGERTSGTNTDSGEDVERKSVEACCSGNWCHLDVIYCFIYIYSRRFATATARTASLGSHSRGMIQGRSGKWSGGVEARRALLSDGLPSHEGSPVVTMGVFNTKSWSNGRFGANIAPWCWTPAILSQKISPFP